MSLVLHLHRQDSFVISSPSSCVYDTQTLAFAVSLWCWSVTCVVVQLVPENRNPLEVADESPAKLAALQQNSEGHLQAHATEDLNDGSLLQDRLRKGHGRRWG